MKKSILITILILLESFCFAETKINLEEYFDNNEYFTKKYELDFAEIYYSYQYADGANRLVNKAIIYLKENNSIQSLLIIDKNKIFNSSELLFEGIIFGQQFYGYDLRISHTSGYISTGFYTDNGKHVTDGPSFKLDKKTMKYTEVKIDPSEY